MALQQVVGVGVTDDGSQSPGRSGPQDTPRAAGLTSEAGGDGGSVLTESVLDIGPSAARSGGQGGGGSMGGGSSTGAADRTAGAGPSVGGSRGPTLQLLIEGLGLDDQIEQLLRISALADQEWEEAQSTVAASNAGSGTPVS